MTTDCFPSCPDLTIHQEEPLSTSYQMWMLPKALKEVLEMELKDWRLA